MATGLDGTTKRNVDSSMAEILEAIKVTGTFQRLVVEYYSNGTIKRIEKELNHFAIITVGLTTIAFGVTVHFLGPSNVTEYAKAALAAAQAVEAVSSVARGKPVPNGLMHPMGI
ncbi:unnamed protein product [Adineta ricciae]|uniref:Uncharacterized protein n=1 Tax=Adineta ricciae TaxID=249248 RepID=A0A815ZAK5_ADIRI|nr:unnamed protein product [Adineta ricciae]CAF1581044.1 unnamed protein product [Adineta ricciae]